MRRLLPLLLFVAAAPLFAANPPEWTEPVEPFRIVGNLYYVGTAELTSYLIVTPEGDILLDAPLKENVPHILRSIRKLGFDPHDIRIMISSHAHFDHAGGFAEMKRITGAKLLMSPEDAALAARGGKDDFAFGDTGLFEPVEADGLIHDGQKITLGGTTLAAIATPGHTKGGTSWSTEIEDAGRRYRVVFANSMTAPGYQLHDNPKYPGIMEDFRRSFDRLAGREADVLLSTHGSSFGLRERIAHLDGPSNPFIDPTALGRWVTRQRAGIEKKYEEQKKAARP